MINKILILLLLSIFFICSGLVAQTKEDPKSDKAKDEKKFQVADPVNSKEAEALFMSAIQYQQKEKFEEALLCYEKLAVFYRKQTDDAAKKFLITVLNNWGTLLSNVKGDYEATAKLLQEATVLAGQLKMYKEMASLFYKLGILHDYLADFQRKLTAEGKLTVTQDGKLRPEIRKLFTNQSFSGMSQQGGTFSATQIKLDAFENPFENQNDIYTKLTNLKVKGDFRPDLLLIPDNVKFRIEITKRGYYNLRIDKDMLPEVDYSELPGLMLAIPRKVDPTITEDFYREGPVIPDEISLAFVDATQSITKPVAITDRETFKPGTYRLTIQKAGYEAIGETITIYPDEGSFDLKREIKSKLRGLTINIRGDYTAGGTDVVVPDEISLNNQNVSADSKVKPAEYKLVLKKEGYEPVVKTILIKPDERPYAINEMMKSLPREVLVQVTGDYVKDTNLTPDEITFNGKYVKLSGESLRPDAYRVVIRKRGYEPITKRVLIEPKNEPFVLKESMVSLPRRVQPNIFASFPAGQRLFADTCTLNEKDVNTTENFKPGTYNLVIKHRGYIPITKTIEIEPDDKAYSIQHTLDPKDVQINLEVSFDVAPENPNIAYVCGMENEKTKENKKIKTGDKVQPESYMVKLECPGYEQDVQRELIMPRDDAYLINRRMISSQRRVVTEISAEYPDGPVTPDEITINNKPVGKDFKIKPGNYDLVILKEGYVPIRKQIKILASDRDYVLSERLETKSRVVTFNFIDSFDNRKLNPEEVLLNKEKLTSMTISLKPGDYALFAGLKGYAPVDDTINIPVSSEAYTITKKMVAIKRDVLTQINGDFKPDQRLIPDRLVLNDTVIGEKGTVKPGPYTLNIEKKGYYPIIEKITIEPGQTPYLIKRTMQSKPRKVNLNIKSSFTNSKIAPQSIVIGNQNVKDGQEVKPGEYSLSIKEKGYQPVSSNIVIEPSEESYTLEYILESLPRLVKYELTSDYDQKLTAPDVINLNDKPILDQKSTFLPGKYTVRIEKRGFQTKEFDTVIEPDEVPYVIRGTLESLPRAIQAIITGDFPKGERIDPELVALGGKEARNESFKPGKYELLIQNSGYFPLKKEALIPPGEEEFIIEEELITKPRMFKEKISYDVMPPDSLPPYKITIASMENPKAEKVIKDGETVKPNSYILRITKEAYETIEEKLHIWPDEKPQVLDKQLVAKQVTIRINIAHDVPPPSGLEEYKVSLIDKVTGVLQLVVDGRKIKPGTYDLNIQRPGYNFGTNKKIDILPSEQAYFINESLAAKPRNISFDMTDETTGQLVPAVEILEQKTGKSISFKDTFPAGSQVGLIIKFKNYKTAAKMVHIEPGEGPLVVKVALQKLAMYEFNVRSNEMTLDNINYTYEFYADNEKVEPHLIATEKGMGRIYYKLYAPPEAQNLRVFAGYLFSQKSFAQVSATGVGVLEQIGIAKLIEHLGRLSQQDDRKEKLALDIMDQMLKRPADVRKLKQCHPTEIDQLIQYVENWKFTAPQDRVKQQDVVEKIAKLKG